MLIFFLRGVFCALIAVNRSKNIQYNDKQGEHHAYRNNINLNHHRVCDHTTGISTTSWCDCAGTL